MLHTMLVEFLEMILLFTYTVFLNQRKAFMSLLALIDSNFALCYFLNNFTLYMTFLLFY